MGIQRQIRINRNGGSVSFDPADLGANVGDQIFWTNSDTEAHWPGLPDDKTFFMPNQIAPGSSSSVFAPGLVETIDYVCSLHPEETGRITIADPTQIAVT